MHQEKGTKNVLYSYEYEAETKRGGVLDVETKVLEEIKVVEGNKYYAKMLCYTDTTLFMNSF